MSNIDEFMKKAGEKLNVARDVVMDMADKAGKKAGELYGDAKIRIKIADVQRDINNLYKEIGKAAYTANRAGEDVAPVIDDKCDEVRRLYDEMEELSKSLNKNTDPSPADDDDGVIEVEVHEAPEAPEPTEEAPEPTEEAPEPAPEAEAEPTAEPEPEEAEPAE